MVKYLITGTGRSGTTALLTLFDKIGLQTEMHRLSYNSGKRAGFEYTGLWTEGDPNWLQVVKRVAPEVVKDPRLCWYLGEACDLGLKPKHVFVCVRDQEDAVISREKAELLYMAHDRPALGGDIEIADTRLNQLIYNQRALATLITDLVLRDIPYTTIAFPRFVKDPEYLHEKLRKVDDRFRHMDRFREACECVFHPQWADSWKT